MTDKTPIEVLKPFFPKIKYARICNPLAVIGIETIDDLELKTAHDLRLVPGISFALRDALLAALDAYRQSPEGQERERYLSCAHLAARQEVERKNARAAQKTLAQELADRERNKDVLKFAQIIKQALRAAEIDVTGEKMERAIRAGASAIQRAQKRTAKPS